MTMRTPLILMGLLLTLLACQPSASESFTQILQRVQPGLQQALEKQGLRYGAPIFIRIFKQPAILEVWVENAQKKFEKFKTYPICQYSGELGPKLKEGDSQAPEGFYAVGARQLNPHSDFHLAFNLGYPNAYDRVHQRTGSYLMVHGNCVSIGCYAMTDAGIEEIYSLAYAALQQGQAFFRVHIFPFPLTEARLAAAREMPWYAFWENLKTGYDWFERTHRPPAVAVLKQRYVFSAE